MNVYGFWIDTFGKNLSLSLIIIAHNFSTHLEFSWKVHFPLRMCIVYWQRFISTRSCVHNKTPPKYKFPCKVSRWRGLDCSDRQTVRSYNSPLTRRGERGITKVNRFELKTFNKPKQKNYYPSPCFSTGLGTHIHKNFIHISMKNTRCFPTKNFKVCWHQFLNLQISQAWNLQT